MQSLFRDMAVETTPDARSFAGRVLINTWNSVKSTLFGEPAALDDMERYSFDHKRRGVALIVCNDKFQGQAPRQGSEHDVKHFEKTFIKFGFSPQDIRIRYNMNAGDMLDWFLAVSMEDHSDADCLMVAISSHGDEYRYTDPERSNVTKREDVIHTTDKVIFTRDLVDIFRDKHCPSLKDKPKIFLLQACRGTKLDDGVEIQEEDMDVVDAMTEPEYTISPPPCFKDFCIVYATPPGHYAFRRPSEGSWFVKAFWDVVERVDPSRVDFLRLVTLVIHQVAFSFQSSAVDPRIDGKKQSGCIYSMLTKDIYFTPKQEADELML
ncbi:caspase-3-like isoform X2 [Haliotis rufescens]|uniref:caspase-3-like isoform X2 n=1 Tax=Haliotis rufescens TaxID=6454 RepID=UPI00201F4C6D|nr:caspase-3-like isoform X2 [Haliotis rufescens]